MSNTRADVACRHCRKCIQYSYFFVLVGASDHLVSMVSKKSDREEHSISVPGRLPFSTHTAPACGLSTLTVALLGVKTPTSLW